MDVRAVSHLLVKPALNVFSLDEYSLLSCCLWYHSAMQFALHCILTRLAMSAMSHHPLLPCCTGSAVLHILCFLPQNHVMRLQPCHRISQALISQCLAYKFPFVCNRYWNTLPQFISHIGKVTTTVTSSSGATETCLSSTSSSAANETYADPLANIGASGATSTAVMSVSGLIGAVLLCMLLL